jgi:hypothetical protein
MKVEIYLHDLTPEAQAKVLKFLNAERPEDQNLDVFPLFVMEK